MITFITAFVADPIVDKYEIPATGWEKVKEVFYFHISKQRNTRALAETDTVVRKYEEYDEQSGDMTVHLVLETRIAFPRPLGRCKETEEQLERLWCHEQVHVNMHRSLFLEMVAELR